MATYDKIAGLPLTVESVGCEHREVSVRGGMFTRATTLVVFRGAGEEGVGEDVTYDAEAHEPFQVRLRVGALPLVGEWESFDAFSRSLEAVELFDVPPTMHAFVDYRRWALESAALDLALRQAGQSLAAAVGREPRPVSFVVSFGLGDPPSAEPVRRWLDLYPGLRFKLDGTSAWTDELVTELAATGAVDTIDLKGAYRGTPVDQAADARLYRLVAEGFPEAWIEDPNLDDEAAAAALAPHRERITWDAPIHSVADVEALPFAPRTINVKPSRFGTVRRLLEAYDYCAERGIGVYGGGQFELGPGRDHIQYLASLFHPEGSNDVAPREYNGDEPVVGLPTSPLTVQPAPAGFGWG
jgi:L-alanine-DL-glutamate epimerase-like enolase superfamily enzyme